MSDGPAAALPTSTVDVLDRCGLLAAWTSAVLDHRVAPDRALSVLRDPGSPLAGSRDSTTAAVHLTETFDLPGPGPGPDGVPFPATGVGSDGFAPLLALCRRRGVTRLWCAAAAPGDVAALPGPPPLNAAAVAAGGAVLMPAAAPGSGLALVPSAREHGTEENTERVLTWRALPMADGPGAPGALPALTLAEGDRLLLEALRDAVSSLDVLDVAARDPRSDAVRRSADAAIRLLPPGTPERAHTVRGRALVVLHAVEVANVTDGAAVSASAMAARVDALRPAAAAARAALAAAWNAATVGGPRAQPAPSAPARGLVR